MSAQGAAHRPTVPERRMLLLVEAAVAADSQDEAIAADVGLAVELAAISGLRSCSLSVAHPYPTPDPNAAVTVTYRRLLLVAEVALAPDAYEDEVAADVAMAIRLGGIAGLRSCGVAMARPHLRQAAS